MANEALVSLTQHIIERFLNQFRNSYFPIPKTIDLVLQEVWSLKSILELDHFEESERLNASKEEILEAIPRFKDVLEGHINNCLPIPHPEPVYKRYMTFLGRYYQHEKVSSNEREKLMKEKEKVRKDMDKAEKDMDKVRKDWKKVEDEMISFVETMKKIKNEYIAKLDQGTSNKESQLADEDFGGNAKDMVGVYDEDLQQLIHKLHMGRPSYGLKTIAVVGMAGIGKTTIVKALYNHPKISKSFKRRGFVRVGPDYHLKDILLDLLDSFFPKYHKVNKILGIEKSEVQLKEQINKFLNNRRYLIVLDDVWDTDFLDGIKKYLPENNNGSKIIVTTRLSGVALYNNADGNNHEIRFRNEKESWNLFCRKVFVEDSCPLGLEKVGKKIVKKCGGLPLGIISIANILSKAKKTLDYWEKVAKNENLLALITEEGSTMSDTLFLSYRHLPLHLKECCLYFGVFPLNHEISVSKLVKLWVGEGLAQPKCFKTLEDTAREYLEDLVSHNIVLVRQQSSSGKTKTCTVHYFFWHLLVREAANKKIFHLINSYPSAFSEDIHCQRRLCIQKNALLGLKRVSESIQSVSNVRSFLCTGPEHQYPVSICSALTSIKVLDALTIRLYKFPIGILDLVELKYLAFTYDGKLPSSISRLKNLVYLIVHRYHMTIINSSPSYMPIEIWNMKELRHLQVMGSDLPHPVDGAKLPNLLTLLGVSDCSCRKEVLQSIPNLERLAVQIVLPPGVSETFHIFDHLALLSRLKAFKCIVSNPNSRSQQVLFLPKSVFPSSLTKLTLSGCGFAWEDMSIIVCALTKLRVLKLRCYAFQGPEWVVDRTEFPKLEHLLLEDIDLVQWKVGCDSFPLLKRLIIRHCYELEKIPHELGNSTVLKVIELDGCSPSTLKSVKQIQEERRKRGNDELQSQIYSSLDDEKH